VLTSGSDRSRQNTPTYSIPDSDNSDAGESNVSSSIYTAETLEEEIEETIGQIVDLSVLLRKEGAQQHEDRAKDFEPKDEHGNSLQNDFVAFVDFVCTRRLQNKNGFIPEDFLTQRLKRITIKRWRLIHYRIHHADRMNLDAQISIPVAEEPGVGTSSKSVGRPQGGMEASKSAPSVTKTKQSTATTRQSAATTLPADYKPPISRPSKSLSIASSKTQFSPHALNFPRPPKVQTHEQDFKCPYCCLPEPAKTLGRRSWEYVGFSFRMM